MVRCPKRIQPKKLANCDDKIQCLNITRHLHIICCIRKNISSVETSRHNPITPKRLVISDDMDMISYPLVAGVVASAMFRGHLFRLWPGLPQMPHLYVDGFGFLLTALPNSPIDGNLLTLGRPLFLRLSGGRHVIIATSAGISQQVLWGSGYMVSSYAFSQVSLE